MRHRKAVNNFSRHPCHRRAMLRNMVINLIEHGRIRTTIQKAKAARVLAEKIITMSKKGTLAHRRQAVETLGSTVAAKATIRKLFGEVSERFKDRNGGYTRILRLPRTIRQATSDLPRGSVMNRSKMYGTRLGDNATMVLWELCEAEIQKKEKPKRKKSSNKPKAKKQDVAPVAAAPSEDAPASEATE